MVSVKEGSRFRLQPRTGANRSRGFGKCVDLAGAYAAPLFAPMPCVFMRRVVFVLLLGAVPPGPFTRAAEVGVVASKPLYRDPVFDGAADPVVIWNPHVKRWWMFYTNRRANVPGLSGVAWVHGTRIGIAESANAGASWSYVGTAEIDLPQDVGGVESTHWAPEVITAPDGGHHMFLTVVPGVFEDWQHPRRIVHLTSADLRTWRYVSTLGLAADRVIDACVSPLPGGGWRMWYNNERDGKSIYYADSRDLATWIDGGKVESINARGEGPYVFTWRGRHWMLVDTWRGLGVYRSLDLERWTAQPNLLLDQAGIGADDGVNGGHPCVVVSGGRAFCFYFTHPGRGGTITPQDKDALELRRSSIQVVELVEKDGWLTCDRDAPTPILLESPDTPRAPPGSASTVMLERTASDEAKLRALGNRDVRAHDPSTLALCDGEYWMFYTGRGIGSWHSKNLQQWDAGPRVFEESPAWVAQAVPENRNANFWAPDIIKVGGRYLLYYSVSSFGKRTSAIALATNATLNPRDPSFRWRDEGIVIRSGTADNFNAIDPALFHDDDGKLWMVFGSFWSGIKLMELDPATGKRVGADSPLHALAHSRAIEAAFLHRRDGHYYLFVNHGWCCRGINSTYHIRVGRSDKITGPYLDREGRALLAGGGTVALESEGPFIGPGHAGIIAVGDTEWFSCHFYDATQRGRPTFALRPLTWDAGGWPVVGTDSPR
jgi:beta-xylosidase